MTGYVDDPMDRRDPWAQDRIYRRITDDLRLRYESQGNLAVQTVVLLTSVEQLMEKTNVLLGQLNATMSDLLGKVNEPAARNAGTGGAGPDKDGDQTEPW